MLIKACVTRTLLIVLFAAHIASSFATVAHAEPFRPSNHFTPERGWMNDPNGMVYYQGQYHLFYQYYPDDTVWGPMHWGHATSKDLVNWIHQPVALEPDNLGYIFSGSTVVDWENSSGLGSRDNPPLVALFTYHNPERAKRNTRDHEYQGLAYSVNNGQTWIKHAKNPVLPNPGGLQDFRDPKVFWHKASNKWVMALSVTDHVQFWSSPNLLDWHYMSSFGQNVGAHGGVWECPDLFELPVQGTNQTKWVLLLNLNPGGPQGGSGVQYFVGDFDGQSFTLDKSFATTLQQQTALWLDVGSDNYAAVSWSDIPETDGRRLIIGWMSNWDYAQQVPTQRWRSAMTIPRELALAHTQKGYRVVSRPVQELAVLRQPPLQVTAKDLNDDGKLALPQAINLMRSEFILEFNLKDNDSTVGFSLSNEQGEHFRFSYDRQLNTFISDRTHAGIADFSDTFAQPHRAIREDSENDKLKIHAFVDSASIELFIDNGLTTVTETFFPHTPYQHLTIEGEESFQHASVFALKPAQFSAR
ncbi:glycoside hydrolase family 32 protein [Alteromonas facilis]|uniref:glycoside hydrolase family 32 protein n=1 Tax=Alteromonas facilis TaxID=2048004 RepID=UPI000C293AA9|nr:glycoside hydrolase family 32 protein [Alteromonas facilis]